MHSRFRFYATYLDKLDLWEENVSFHIPVLIIDPSLYFIYLCLTQLYFVVKYTELCAFNFRPYGFFLSGSL